MHEKRPVPLWKKFLLVLALLGGAQLVLTLAIRDTERAVIASSVGPQHP